MSYSRWEDVRAKWSHRQRELLRARRHVITSSIALGIHAAGFASAVARYRRLKNPRGRR